jgi:hypothetical protein
VKPAAYTKLAQREIDAAAQWFENRKEVLGFQFYERIDEPAEKIALNPEGFQTL